MAGQGKPPQGAASASCVPNDRTAARRPVITTGPDESFSLAPGAADQLMMAIGVPRSTSADPMDGSAQYIWRGSCAVTALVLQLDPELVTGEGTVTSRL